MYLTEQEFVAERFSKAALGVCHIVRSVFLPLDSLNVDGDWSDMSFRYHIVKIPHQPTLGRRAGNSTPARLTAHLTHRHALRC